RALANAPEIGAVSSKGLETLMRHIEESTLFMMDNLNKPVSAGSEHLFAWTHEKLIGKSLIHGEMVSLGILISSYLQKSNHAELKKALDEGKVIYKPDEIGLPWEEIEQTLLGIPEY